MNIAILVLCVLVVLIVLIELAIVWWLDRDIGNGDRRVQQREFEEDRWRS